jgi:sarcosine oxidase subunit alpha
MTTAIGPPADLHAKGVSIAAVIDVRPDAPQSQDYEIITEGQVINSRGRLGLKSIEVALPCGATRQLACGALGVAGGWNPNMHLTSHHRGRPEWLPQIAAFGPPSQGPKTLRVAGAAKGDLSTAGALRGGTDQAARWLGENGFAAAGR